MTQFRTSDGTRLWYELRGPADGPVVVLCDGVACDGYAWKYLSPRLEKTYRVLHMHYRGHGRSGLPRDLGRSTLPVLATDHIELMDALGLEEAVWIGHSMGCQLVLELAFRHGERVRAGVLVCGSYGRALDTLKNTDLGHRLLPYVKDAVSAHRPWFEALMRIILPNRLGYAIATLSEVNKDKVRREDFMPYLDHVARMSHELVAHLLTDAAERTTLAFLRRLEQPMLVVAAESDGFTPPHTSKLMADLLPRAEFRLLHDATHTAPIEEPERLASLVEGFLASLRRDQPGATPDARRGLLARWRDQRAAETVKALHNSTAPPERAAVRSA
jgi:pimeloyl-ACP methyl ester carboxylesterase